MILVPIPVLISPKFCWFRNIPVRTKLFKAYYFRFIVDLKQNEIKGLPIRDPCPNSCACAYNRYYDEVTLNCSGQGMTTFPERLPARPSSSIWLHMENNSIADLGAAVRHFVNKTDTNYGNIRYLFLSHNKISKFRQVGCFFIFLMLYFTLLHLVLRIRIWLEDPYLYRYCEYIEMHTGICQLFSSLIIFFLQKVCKELFRGYGSGFFQRLNPDTIKNRRECTVHPLKRASWIRPISIYRLDAE
jgi:hypothetical protein